MVRLKEGETRKYVVPLRKEWLKTARWRRSKRAVDALRRFIIRHTKVENVRVSNWVNEEIWKHGGKNPPHKIEVNAKIEKEKVQDKKTKKDVDVRFVQVELSQLPKRAERLEKRRQKKIEGFKKVAAPKETKKEPGEKKETIRERVKKKITKKEAPKEKKKSVKELAAELHEAEEKKKKAAKITKSQEMKMKQK